MWLPVVGYEGKYLVSDAGEVRTLPGPAKDERTLKPSANDRGYHVVQLYDGSGKRKTCRVHRIVLEAFVGPAPEGYQACHNNGNRIDNRLENLRWDSASENQRDITRHGNNHFANRTHCPRNHLLDPPNLVPSSLKKGRRDCLSCSRARQRIRNGYGTDLQEVSDTIYQRMTLDQHG